MSPLVEELFKYKAIKRVIKKNQRYMTEVHMYNGVDSNSHNSVGNSHDYNSYDSDHRNSPYVQNNYNSYNNHAQFNPLVNDVAKNYNDNDVNIAVNNNSNSNINSVNTINGIGVLPQNDVRSYIIYGVIISLGLKMADTFRRISLYTKPNHTNKTLFSFLRGLFPLQELCGATTALQLAKADILKPLRMHYHYYNHHREDTENRNNYYYNGINGINNNGPYKVQTRITLLSSIISTINILLPSLFLHGMANFRGMKPLFVWDSSRPWDEIQLQMLNNNIHTSQKIVFGMLNVSWYILVVRSIMDLIQQCYSSSDEHLYRKEKMKKPF